MVQSLYTHFIHDYYMNNVQYSWLQGYKSDITRLYINVWSNSYGFIYDYHMAAYATWRQTPHSVRLYPATIQWVSDGYSSDGWTWPLVFADNITMTYFNTYVFYIIIIFIVNCYILITVLFVFTVWKCPYSHFDIYFILQTRCSR